MKTFKSILILSLIAVITLLSACAQAPAARPQQEPAPVKQQASPPVLSDYYLVLVSIDACRPDYFTFSDIPNIKALMKEGVSYNNAWVGQLRNNTPPGHTTMSTGSFPRDDGILCFGWRDPANNNGELPTSWKNVTSGFMTNLIIKSGATSIGALYKQAHPGAKVAAVSSDKFYAATGLGADSADYILFSKSGDARDYAHTANSNLEPSGVQSRMAPPEIMNDPSLTRAKNGKYDSDSWAMDAALKLFEKERPQVLLINLPDTDEAGHASGGINSPAVMSKVVSNADAQIGRLVAAYKAAGIYDRTIFVITSDHAMTPSAHIISQAKVNELIQKAGTKGTESNEFYVWNQDKSGDVAENIAAAGIPGIYGTYYLTKNAAGGYVYLPSPTTAVNITGDLDRCYRYLLSTYASAKSPDVFIATAENWRQDYKVFGLWFMPGSHDSVTWLVQHVPLVISGPGVKKGVSLESPARLVDIAPTVLALMGIAPQHMDGTVLADAFVTATPAMTGAQQALNAELAPLEAALKKLSDDDLAAEKK
jgi:predicted AlkP superfamily pyrophosphatase or phosphodiesterase